MNYLDYLPPEILHKIAGDSEPAYFALILSYPRFARAVNYDNRLDYMISFGHDVRVINNCIVWSRNGTPHRCGYPAILYPNGEEQWYYNGKKHRDGGPAVTSPNGKKWYQNGLWHRIDGPAVLYFTNPDEWHQHKGQNIIAFPPNNYGHAYLLWYRNGKKHRSDGPAVIHANGDQRWYRNGLLHRDKGPAIIYPNEQIWYINGVRTRIESPSV